MADTSTDDINSEETSIPNDSAIGLVLPKPNTSEKLQLVGKNDEHEDSMKQDDSFMAQVQERNEQSNQLMNLNNAALTQFGDNAAQNADVLIANTNEDFINKKWRPMMAFVYMITCMCDFVIFPILWSILQFVSKGSVTTPWQPLTLQGAGLYHIAMGAFLGIATFGRTQEKIAGVANMSMPGSPGK